METTAILSGSLKKSLYILRQMKNPGKIALVHDWLVTMRGGEKVFEVLCELFPSATVYTLVHKPGGCSGVIERMKIIPSILQRIPGGIDRYQYFLPFFPFLIRQFDARGYDLVISSSHAVAKAIRVHPDSLHVCYCHTPMRYVWDQYDHYFSPDRAGKVISMAMKLIAPPLRRFDVRTAANVDFFVANSDHVKKRIERIYHRTADVLYPPVDMSRFRLSERDQDYYLIVSALVPYKRIDLAIEAFNRLGERLLIIGNGPEEEKLKSAAKNNIEFLDWVNDGDLPGYYEGCRALIFPGEEDFGIVPVEAMACGKPVIAFAGGGALETVVDGRTGIYFHEQTAESLFQAVRTSSAMRFDPQEIRSRAMRFDRKIFKEEIQSYIGKRWKEHLIQQPELS